MNINEKQQSDTIQKLEKINRIIVRDKMKFLFHGYKESQINQFNYELLKIKQIPNDQHYKRKQAKKSEKKCNKKRLLTDLCNKHFELSTSNLNVTFPIDANSLSDKELLHTGCLLLEKIKKHCKTETNKQKDLLELETEIAQFEESIYEHNEATLLRIRKSLERNGAINDIIEQSNQICAIGRSIWHTINYTNYEDYCLFNDTTSNCTLSVSKITIAK